MLTRIQDRITDNSLYLLTKFKITILSLHYPQTSHEYIKTYFSLHSPRKGLLPHIFFPIGILKLWHKGATQETQELEGRLLTTSLFEQLMFLAGFEIQSSRNQCHCPTLVKKREGTSPLSDGNDAFQS